MICPSCHHDNIPGVDACEECGQTLTRMEEPGSEWERAISEQPVRKLAPRTPVMVPAHTSVRVAVDTMVEQCIGCLLVEEDGKVAGIFTERDVLNRVLPDRGTLDQPVSSVMTPAPQTISLQDSIAYAMHEMAVGGYRHLPVADADGAAVGIISARDLVRFLSTRFAKPTGSRS
jgi:CBS domain-containing protein